MDDRGLVVLKTSSHGMLGVHNLDLTVSTRARYAAWNLDTKKLVVARR